MTTSTCETVYCSHSKTCDQISGHTSVLPPAKTGERLAENRILPAEIIAKNVASHFGYKRTALADQGPRSPPLPGAPTAVKRIYKTARNKFSRFLSSGWRDLNPRPLDPQSSALPSCATARIQFIAVATCRTIAHLAKQRQADHSAPRHTAASSCSYVRSTRARCRKTEQMFQCVQGDYTGICPHTLHP